MVLLLNGVASHDLSLPLAGFLPGDHLRQSGPSMVAIVGPGGLSTATQFAVDSLGGPVVVGTTCSMTVHMLVREFQVTS